MEWDEDEIVVEITADVVEVEIAETATDVTVDEEKIELEITAPEETGLEITEDLIELELVADPEIVIEVGEGSGKAVWGFITGELPDQTDLAAALAGKSDTGHTHDDRYYTEQEIDAALAVISAALSGKSDVGHTHDDRYYTQGEIDAALSVINTALSGKSNVGHTHDDRYYTEQEIDAALAVINTALAGKSNTGHTHDDRYYTESEVDSRVTVKVSKSGDIMTGTLYIDGKDLILRTTGSGSDDSGDIAWYYGNGQEKMRIWSANTYSSKIGPYFRVYAKDGTSLFNGTLSLSDHLHDGRYYTESEMDTKLGEKVSKSGDSMTGAINFNNKGACSVYNGPNDAANGVGGALNNFVISSWWGVSFTTSCSGTYQNKNAVSIDCRTGNVYAKTFNGGLSTADAIKNITRSGTTFTATRADGTTFTFTQQDSDTKYTAGTGLGLSGTSFYIPIPRVAESCNALPSVVASLRFREYTAGANYNLPSNAWYQILEIRSFDANYGTQLALGMTTDAAYYRKYAGGSWGSWKSLTDVGDNIKVKSVSATMAANSNSANISASADSGYTFLTWYGATPSGFGGVFHFTNYASASTTVWQDYGATTSSRTVTCYFLEKK